MGTHKKSIAEKRIKSTISGIIPVLLTIGVRIMYLPRIGEKLKQLRKQKKLSQVTLAERLGVSKSVISAYENEVHLPPYDVLLKLSRIFGVSTDYLLGATSNRTINVDGLTEIQVEALTNIVRELRETNRGSGQ